MEQLLVRTLRLLALCTLLAACSALPERNDVQPSHVIADTADTRLARELQPLLERHDGLSGFRTLSEGEEAFYVRLELIRTAQRSLDLQYYIWHDDLTGRVTHEALLRAADRGVRVRLLLDDLDTAGKDDLLRRIDAHPNIDIRLFNPFANRNMRVGDFLGDTARVNRRMHNKTLTADNVATVFGGRNIGDEYFEAHTELAFGDLDALAIGPIAQEVSSQFDLYWNSVYAYPLAAFEWDDTLSEEAVAEYRRESSRHLEEARDSKYADVLRQLEIADVDSIAQLDFVWSKWLLAYDQPVKLETEELSDETHMVMTILEGMRRTERDLIIVSPYFVPGERLTDYLVAMVERGVRVRILTNSLQANDVALVHAGYMRYRKDLVAGGVELFEYKSTSNKLRRRFERERLDVERTSLHAKFFGFDEEFLFVGSFNLDGRSAIFNTELGAYFASPQGAKTLSSVFEEHILSFAYQVELDDRNRLRWVTEDDGVKRVETHEPDTTWWKRFNTRFMSLIVPEKQL